MRQINAGVLSLKALRLCARCQSPDLILISDACEHDYGTRLCGQPIEEHGVQTTGDARRLHRITSHEFTSEALCNMCGYIGDKEKVIAV